MNEIDARSLQEKLKEPAPPLLLDVRNPPELAAEGRIEGSVNIPLNELPGRFPRPARSSPCARQGCARSTRPHGCARWGETPSA